MVTLRPLYCQPQKDHISLISFNCSNSILKYFNTFILIRGIVCCSLLMVKFFLFFRQHDKLSKVVSAFGYQKRRFLITFIKRMLWSLASLMQEILSLKEASQHLNCIICFVSPKKKKKNCIICWYSWSLQPLSAPLFGQNKEIQSIKRGNYQDQKTLFLNIWYQPCCHIKCVIIFNVLFIKSLLVRKNDIEWNNRDYKLHASTFSFYFILSGFKNVILESVISANQWRI